MPILSDSDIGNLLSRGELKISPFKEENLTPNGYDVTVGEVYIPSKEETVREGVAKIPPLTRFLISTKEVVEFGPAISGSIWIRTTWARRGVLASFGKVDAGFRGTLTLAAFNSSNSELELPIGETFSQLVFHKLSSPTEETYETRSGTYQDQRGVTLDRPSGRKRSASR